MEIIFTFIQNTGNLIFFYIIPTVVVLGIMIFFHELGHFLAAKYFNVKVLKFALGFGPRITAREWGETEYSIRYFPLGGFVKMLGEDETDEESQDITPEDEQRAFNHQYPLKRIVIVAAGPVFNILLAWVLFFGLFMVKGDLIAPSKITEVTEGTPAETAGLKAGDVILSAQDINIENLGELHSIIDERIGLPLSLIVRRGERNISVTVIPEEHITKNEFGEEVKTGRIGIAGRYERVRLNPLEAVQTAYVETVRWIKLTCLVVVKLFQGVVPFKTVGGPLMIGQMTGEIVQESVGSLVPVMAIISINLGILNLLPIPILDGGVILFLLFELILRRPISLDKQELAQKIGLSLLILLMIFVFYNDILRFIK
ncbi:RIP metalloprotease RseP [Thermodesulfobacteriota bacterium]